MTTTEFDYARAESLDDALTMLAEGSMNTKLLDGGHGLLPAMKLRLSMPNKLIDISEVDELAALAAQISDPQVRNRGTLGGSLAHADPAADYPAHCLPVMGAGQGAAYAKFSNPASRYAVVGVAAMIEMSGGPTSSRCQSPAGEIGAGPPAANSPSPAQIDLRCALARCSRLEPSIPMAQLNAASPPESDGVVVSLADRIVAFGRVLRQAGLQIGSDQVMDAMRAVETVGAERRADGLQALFSIFVHRPADAELFDQAFRIFWQAPSDLDEPLQQMLPTTGDARLGGGSAAAACGAGAPGR